jgi:hypothetical protein
MAAEQDAYQGAGAFGHGLAECGVAGELAARVGVGWPRPERGQLGDRHWVGVAAGLAW